jgi:hypothetical protein
MFSGLEGASHRIKNPKSVFGSLLRPALIASVREQNISTKRYGWRTGFTSSPRSEWPLYLTAPASPGAFFLRLRHNGCSRPSKPAVKEKSHSP